MTILWRIYYSDNTFDSSQGTLEDAPAFGVVCIVSPNDLVGRVILHRHDFYYWVPPDGNVKGYWSGGDARGVFDRLLFRLPFMALLEGRNVRREVFNKVMVDADKDPDFDPSSGKLAR